VRFSGQTAHILAVYRNIKSVMPKGDSRCNCGLKEDSNGVTARLYIDLPPEALGVLSAAAAPSDSLSLPARVDMICDAEIVEQRKQIDQRYKVTWRR
jgi:hypothetical protein